MPGKKDFNKGLKSELSQELPLMFSRPEDPVLGGTMTSVVIRGDEAAVDDAFLHGRSAIERGIKWTKSRDEVEGGDTYWVVWVAMRGGGQGLHYVGMVAEDIIINREQRRGYKDLAAQVNRMSDALAGRFDLGNLPERETEALRHLISSKGHDTVVRSAEPIRAFFL